MRWAHVWVDRINRWLGADEEWVPATDAPVGGDDVERIEVYQSKDKDWRWRWVASNGRILADSGEGYRKRSRAFQAAKKISSRTPNVVLAEERT